MEYRSSNANGYVHYSGDVAASVGSSAGAMLSSNTVQAIGDAAAVDLEVKGKGTGVVYIGGSTVPWKIVAGESSFRPPALSSWAQDYSTFAAAGISTGDLILSVDFRGALSTVYLVGTPSPSSASEIKVQMGNVHNSSVSGSSGRVRWLYLDRT